MTLSRAQFENIYNNSILAENPNLSPSLQQGQDLYFKRKGVSQVASMATQEAINIVNNIFPASSTSVLLYKHASNLGLPLFSGALPSYGFAELILPTDITSIPVTFTIPLNTVIVNTNTSIQYFTTESVTFTSGTLLVDLPLIPIQSSLSGANTYSAPSTILTFTTPFVLNTTVTITSVSINDNFTSGLDLLTDSQISNNIYSFMQNPRGGGSTGDYQKWAYQSSDLITNAFVITTGSLLSNQNFLLLVIMGGSSDPTLNVELTYPISRASTTTTINTCNTYIEGVRPVNDNVNIITVSTFGLSATTPNYVTLTGLLNPIIDINVSLSQGLSLSTIITGSNGEVKTVEDWIKYAFRLAILSAPYTGTIYDGATVILGENITTIISNALSSTIALTGYLCSILQNITFKYSDNNVTDDLNIPVPNSNQYYIVGTISTLEIIYDIDVSILNITVIT